MKEKHKNGEATKPKLTDVASLLHKSHASIRGRLEWLTLPPHLLPPQPQSQSHHSNHNNGQPEVKILLDGAHNPQSATALATYITTHLRPSTGGTITYVLSLKTGKQLRTILSTLLQPADNVVTCSFGPVDGMPWVSSVDAGELAILARGYVGKGGWVNPASDVRAAVQTAVEVAGGAGTVVVAGSLYLVGDVLRIVERGISR
jgi:folylpolyglutamate synthase